LKSISRMPGFDSMRSRWGRTCYKVQPVVVLFPFCLTISG
jgi:hypothetical protein